jgi:hypothetical protein
MTEAIRVIAQVRRGIRDQMERNASDTVPAKDLRPGDWIQLAGRRVRVAEVLTKRPVDDPESCSPVTPGPTTFG